MRNRSCSVKTRQRIEASIILGSYMAFVCADLRWSCLTMWRSHRRKPPSFTHSTTANLPPPAPISIYSIRFVLCLYVSVVCCFRLISRVSHTRTPTLGLETLWCFSAARMIAPRLFPYSSETTWTLVVIVVAIAVNDTKVRSSLAANISRLFKFEYCKIICIRSFVLYIDVGTHKTRRLLSLYMLCRWRFIVISVYGFIRICFRNVYFFLVKIIYDRLVDYGVDLRVLNF